MTIRHGGYDHADGMYRDSACPNCKDEEIAKLKARAELMHLYRSRLRTCCQKAVNELHDWPQFADTVSMLEAALAETFTKEERMEMRDPSIAPLTVGEGVAPLTVSEEVVDTADAMQLLNDKLLSVDNRADYWRQAHDALLERIRSLVDPEHSKSLDADAMLRILEERTRTPAPRRSPLPMAPKKTTKKMTRKSATAPKLGRAKAKTGRTTKTKRGKTKS